MIVFLSRGPNGGVFLQVRLEGKDAIGDVAREILPGGEFLGVPYQELAALGYGRQEIEPRLPPPPVSR